MALGLLGMMAGGAAVAHRDAVNAEVDLQNKAGLALFSAEMNDSFAQRIEERKAMQEQKIYDRDRSDLLADEQRKFAREDTVNERSRKHDMTKLEFQRSAALEQESMRQKGADRRGAMGVLASGTNDKAADTLAKNIDSNRKRLFDIQKQMHDPLNASVRAGEDYKRLLENEARELELQIKLDAAKIQKAGSGGGLFNLSNYPKGQ